MTHRIPNKAFQLGALTDPELLQRPCAKQTLLPVDKHYIAFARFRLDSYDLPKLINLRGVLDGTPTGKDQHEKGEEG